MTIGGNIRNAEQNHPFQGILEVTIDRLGDTTAKLGQALVALDSCHSDYKRVRKIGCCQRSYNVITNEQLEDAVNWLNGIQLPALEEIFNALEENALPILEKYQEQSNQLVREKKDELRAIQDSKDEKFKEAERRLNEIRGRKKSLISRIESTEREILKMKDLIAQERASLGEESNDMNTNDMEGELQSVDDLTRQLLDLNSQIEASNKSSSSNSLSFAEKLKIAKDRMNWCNENKSSLLQMCQENSDFFNELVQAVNSDVKLANTWRQEAIKRADARDKEISQEIHSILSYLSICVKILFIPTVSRTIVDILQMLMTAYDHGQSVSLEEFVRRFSPDQEEVHGFSQCILALESLSIVALDRDEEGYPVSCRLYLAD